MEYVRGRLIYENPMAAAEDVKGFVMEGEGELTFDQGRMRIRNTMDESAGQAANLVLWCNQGFPDQVEFNWEFYPLSAKGLCVFFFAAMGRNGEDIFDSSLKTRTGEYQMYHSGDINALHISYYRRMYPSEREFHVANLRKSRGFHLAAQGADPLPYPADARPPYRMTVVKSLETVEFLINGLKIFEYRDDGAAYGPLLSGGKIGFRQMSPMIGEYANFQVYEITGREDGQRVKTEET